MRPTTFTAALFMAATPAFAEMEDDIVSRADSYVTLDNGCVYAPNMFGQDNAWFLVYTEAGTTARCALTLNGVNAPETLTPSEPERIKLTYAVGVFR